ncbi:metallophosphoesterase family protein [Thalassococcus lentus]|uniref:Metallophosphoesterase family protein n=1 Tax=Thalassococcus lentus TaxID=1210524 RepID=A0ABT4XQK0_9RHOB|nr:metallophosphoesterase family protein [Thalassococcus lentus]MDA7424215.1 metallophosphoesterase family protein [Thalassococcus lentus]
MDLGSLEGPLLVFGGPYSNLQATQAVRAQADRLGIPPERCICTGDVVAYCGDAAATVAEIRDWGCLVIAGNCEKQLAAHALDCGCGFDEGTTCDLLSAGWYAHANAQVDGPMRDWMAGLPDWIVFEHAGQKCCVIHGGARDIARFLWPVTPDELLLDELSILPKGTTRVIAGHSGIAFQKSIGPADWLNAGVIGMPAHDGRTQTRFGLIHPDGRFEICLLDYPSDQAAMTMERVGLSQGYHTSLRTGWWPSEDVLPEELRRV